MAPLFIDKASFCSTIFLLAIVFPTLYVASNYLDEVDALLRWKASLHSQNDNIFLPSWTNHHPSSGNNFSARRSVSPCTWYGISCNYDGNIHRLNLSSSTLNGTLDQFSFLSLPNLAYFELSLNYFFGIIPPEISYLSKLVYLDFSCNHFSGIIPPEIGQLTNLVTLHLFENQLCGSIPTEIGKLVSLQWVELQLNNLSGPIPRSLGELRSLGLLRLYTNKLSGPLPKELGNLISLCDLQLGYNQLNGSIPQSLGNLQNLENLFLNDNQFSGPIPEALGKLKLVEVEITNNSFSGNLPDQICNGGKLETLLVGDNKLTGQIPKSLYNCSSLIRVRFDGNQLTGDISESFGVYPHLDYINLNDNKVYGKLSNNWSKCKNITTMQMGGNRISGNILASLCNSRQLEVLNLSSNDLVGEIPKEFGRMTSLLNLVLSENQLSGVVPLELGSLVELSYLDLSMNNLTGSIPRSLGGCSKLFHINMSNNKFTHEIPAQMGRLLHLSVLDLSHNSLTAEIPSELSSLSSLEKLNLSHNKLSGNIPKTLEMMNALWSIDLSYNELQGPIPNNKGFMNISIEALQGNKGLCGNISGLQQCTSAKRNHKIALLISVPLLGALLFGVLSGIFVIYCWKRRMSSTQLVDLYNHGEFFFSISTFDGRETYDEILKATEDFSKAYCIGKGGSGSVYKAKLASDEVVAVKKLHSSLEVVNSNDFLNEIRALTSIRHRNIVKLQGYCSHAQNTFLVYEYLEGGNLAEALRDEAAETLDWTKRLNIIKGVAHALAYMHHDCSPPIVHRDISSKNILLTSDYEACVSDFGTSKILNRNSSNWSTPAGTIGYLAPELACTMKVTEQCDVYSFGVLTLEVIKGEHPGEIVTSLTSTRTEKIALKDLVDQRLPSPSQEIKGILTSVLVLAIRCLNSNPEIRPIMYDVSQKLEWLICNMSKSDNMV